MDATADQTTPPPPPPRLHWLKRTAVGVCIFIAIVAGLRWWWGRHAASMLAAEIEHARIPGIPLYLSEFRQDPVPDVENAALLFKEAASQLALTDPQLKLLRLAVERHPKTQPAAHDVQDLLARTVRLRGLVRQARSRSDCDWGALNINRSPPFLAYSDLGKLIHLAGLDAQQFGRHQEVIEAALDLLHFARCLGTMGPLLSTLIGQQMVDSAGRLLEKSGPDIARSRELRTHLRKAIDSLLEDTPCHQEVAHSLALERALMLDVIARITSAREGANLLHPSAGSIRRSWHLLLLPYIQLDAARLIHRETEVIQACRQPNWPAARAALPVLPEPRKLGPLSGLLATNFGDIIENSFRASANHRLTAVALALWQYQSDRGGFPLSLQVLVPDYIARIPSDPLDLDNLPVHYVRDAAGIRLQCAQTSNAREPQVVLVILSAVLSAPGTQSD